MITPKVEVKTKKVKRTNRRVVKMVEAVTEAVVEAVVEAVTEVAVEAAAGKRHLKMDAISVEDSTGSRSVHRTQINSSLRKLPQECNPIPSLRLGEEKGTFD